LWIEDLDTINVRFFKMLCVSVVGRFEFSDKVFVIAKNVKFELVECLLFDLDLYCVVDRKHRFKHVDSTSRKI